MYSKTMKEILKDYVEEDLPKRELIKPPILKQTCYHLTNIDQQNYNVAEFENGINTKRYNRKTRKKLNNDLENCRFLIIDGVEYDMYDPLSIMSIPIPNAPVLDEDSIPSKFLAKYSIEENEKPNEITILSEMELEHILNRAKELSEVPISEDELILLRELFETEDANLDDEDIVFWLDYIRRPDDEGYGHFEDDYDAEKMEEAEEEKLSKDDLSCELSYRIKNTFSPVLVLPLSYIAANYHICSLYHESEIERAIIQLIALGEDDYGEYLAREMEWRYGYNAHFIIEEGNELKNWAQNHIEFEWLQDNLPGIAPKNVAGYSRMKNMNSARFMTIKSEAEKLGFHINNNAYKREEIINPYTGDEIVERPTTAEHVYVPYYDGGGIGGYYDEELHTYVDNSMQFKEMREKYSEAFEKHKLDIEYFYRLESVIRRSDYKNITALYEAMGVITTDIKHFYPIYDYYIKKVVSMAPKYAKEINKQARESSLVGYLFHKQLAVLLEKAKEYEKLVELCELCIQCNLEYDGTKAGMSGRLVKARNKLNSMV